MSRKSLQDILVTGVTSRLPGDLAKQPDPGGRSQKRHKYAVAAPEARTADGTKYDSKSEMEASLLLQSLEKAGAIRDLKRQVVFKWDTVYRANGHEYLQSPPFYYKADFTYTDVATGEFVVADRKPMTEEQYIARRKRTGKRMESMEVYLRKKRIMKELFGISIKEM